MGLFGKMLSLRRTFATLCVVACILLLADLTGFHRHFYEKDYEQEFSYPLDVPEKEFKHIVHKYRYS